MDKAYQKTKKTQDWVVSKWFWAWERLPRMKRQNGQAKKNLTCWNTEPLPSSSAANLGVRDSCVLHCDTIFSLLKEQWSLSVNSVSTTRNAFKFVHDSFIASSASKSDRLQFDNPQFTFLAETCVLTRTSQRPIWREGTASRQRRCRFM